MTAKKILLYGPMTVLSALGCVNPGGHSHQSSCSRQLEVIADRASDDTSARVALSELGNAPEASSFWSGICKDGTYSLERRRMCVVQLFRRYVRTGMTLEQISVCLGRPSWLS